MSPLFLILAALAADLLLGEPQRAHPLVGFGRLAQGLAGRWNDRRADLWTGVGAMLSLLLPVVGVVAIAVRLPVVGSGFELLFLYWCLGLRGVAGRASAVAGALEAGDLAVARGAALWIPGVDSRRLGTAALNRVAVAAVLQHGCSAAYGVLFWYLCLGPVGAVVFRLLYVLHGLWEPRNSGYGEFGRGVAWTWHLVLWPPALLGALVYWALAQEMPYARAQWRRCTDPDRCLDAVGVAALGLGRSCVLDAVLIRQAVRLVWQGLVVWLVAIGLIFLWF